MTVEIERVRLARVLRAESIEKGEFVLASGRKSSYYLDCRRTTLHPEGAWLTGRLVLDAIDRRGWAPAAVGGMTLGADPIAAAAAVVSFLDDRPLPAFLVRKSAKGHGTGRRIERAPAAGSAVVLVEYVVTSGGSVLEAADACRGAGLDILGVVTIVDREEGGRAALREAGLELEALFTATELLDDDEAP